MSGSSTPTPERETHILAVGQQCSASLCHLVDFLPFKCQHCNLPFCSEHYSPNQHRCEHYDESKYNRVAPSCPLCNTPIAIPPGQDPNIRMESHINTECSVITGKTAKSSAPRCATAKCGKLLFSPIRCDTCKGQFCPQHRFPKDHVCNVPAASSGTKGTTSVQKATSAAGAAALSAIKRAANNSNKSSTLRPSPAPSKAKPKLPAVVAKETQQPKASSSIPPSSNHNPFSKTDRRAKAEKESRLKAMRARAQKGLLSEEEKAILAAEEAELAQKKDDCIIA